MARILWTAQAIEDLHRTPAATRGRLLTRIGLLAEFPQLGSAMDGAYEGFRQFLLGRYRVIYAVDEDEVRIAYIRQGARQLQLRVVPDDDD